MDASKLFNRNPYSNKKIYHLENVEKKNEQLLRKFDPSSTRNYEHNNTDQDSLNQLKFHCQDNQ